MTRQDSQCFSEEISGQLETRVYRLIGSRNGETLCVGKGQGNRVFAHIRAEVGLEGDPADNKLRRIREILLAGLSGPRHSCHGMDEKTALEAEAALIDAYPGLTSVAGGADSTARGAMHAQEIMDRYHSEPAVFHHRALRASHCMSWPGSFWS